MDEVSSSRGSARLKGLFKALLSVAVAWVSLGAASAQQEAQPSPLTLQQAVNIALEKNPLRKVAMADTKVASAGVRAARWEERCNLAAHFRETLPGVPIVASLRRRDKDVSGADYNCPADNPPLWVRTVRQALAGIG